MGAIWNGRTYVMTPDNPIADAFTAFHAANPGVYKRLVKLAHQAKEKGHHQIGIGMLFEVLRWEQHLETADAASEFKLNNNYRSRYARLIMEQEPSLQGIFATRKIDD